MPSHADKTQPTNRWSTSVQVPVNISRLPYSSRGMLGLKCERIAIPQGGQSTRLKTLQMKTLRPHCTSLTTRAIQRIYGPLWSVIPQQYRASIHPEYKSKNVTDENTGTPLHFTYNEVHPAPVGFCGLSFYNKTEQSSTLQRTYRVAIHPAPVGLCRLSFHNNTEHLYIQHPWASAVCYSTTIHNIAGARRAWCHSIEKKSYTRG